MVRGEKTVRLNTENQLTAKAWEKAVQELGKEKENTILFPVSQWHFWFVVYRVYLQKVFATANHELQVKRNTKVFHKSKIEC